MRCAITRSGGPGGLTRALADALDWVKWESLVHSDTRIVIKPNLTWKVPIAGVTTSPAFLEALVALLTTRSRHITVVESDGGYHSFQAEEAFRSHGLYELADRWGVRVLNLSRVPSEIVTVDAGGPLSVQLPSVLLRDVDLFITVPVPKMHAMTRVSLGFKNQWGCQPATMRLRNHPRFAHTLLAINVALRPRLAVFDGTDFLDKSGPMSGEAVRKDLVIAADHVGAGTLACCAIMGVDPGRVRHLRLARRLGLMPASLNEVAFNEAPGLFRDRTFTLRRSPLNYLALAAFHSTIGTRLFYDSRTAGPIHQLLYWLRRSRVLARLMYGPSGPPASEDQNV